MLVPRTQLRSNAVLPAVKKTVSKTADKLSKISFDIRSNKFITEPYKDLFQKKSNCSGGGTYEGMSICDASWGTLC